MNRLIWLAVLQNRVESDEGNTSSRAEAASAHGRPSPSVRRKAKKAADRNAASRTESTRW
jgi:hypothetical protein